VKAKFWSVYILRCVDGSLYTGATNDVEARLERHGRGKGAAYTRSRLPVELVFCEPAEDRGAALRREAAIKKLPRAEKLALLRRKRKGR
jgi:putative endonuclease